MPIITYDDFAGGLDVRPAAALSKTNILRVLSNAYVTKGKSIKKRPCLSFVVTLEAGTVGLKSFSGKLNTFYGAGTAITHADTRFVARRVPHITSGAAPTKIHYADQYSALLYVAAEYGDGTFRHHYLDDPGAWSATAALLLNAFRRPTTANGFRYEATAITDPGVWVTGTVYAANTFRRPTVLNGFRYEVTAGGGGASGGAEPTWPTTVGLTVVDGALTWTCRAYVAAVEPTWPIVVGNTVVDGQVTWTCRTFAITDANCPHTKQVAKQAQKMFAVGTDGTTIRYCKTGAPRDWTTTNDAGFLAAGLYARGSDQVTAIHIYGDSSLAAFFSDNAQLWLVDPDPQNMGLTSNIEGVGTIYHRAAGPVSKDLYFAAQSGYRSLSRQVVTNNVEETDVGSAIDKLIQADFAATDDPLAIYYQKLGQLWSIKGATVWVYSFSSTSKVSAWSKFSFPFTVDDACVLNQELYVRTGNDVYRVTDTVYKDGVSSIPQVDITMFYQDGKRPGVLKQFMGLDHICTGQPMVSFLFFDENGTVHETAAAEYPALTEPGLLYPIELLSTRIAPHYTHQKDEDFELSSLSMHYENLGGI